MFGLLLVTAAAVTAVAGLPAKRQSVTCPNSGQVTTNSACCVWFDVREDFFNNVFLNNCFDNLHGNVRLAFHDAVGFSQELANAGAFPGGGADGSMATFESELLMIGADGASPNAGLGPNVQFVQDIAAAHGVSLGDTIQFAAAAGLTLCPGGPVIPFFAGRPNATAPAPVQLVPTPDQSVTQILARMQDLGPAGFSAQEVVTLLGAHTAGDQSFVDTVNVNQPFDSTPFIWDNQVFLEVLLQNNPGFIGTASGQLQATGVFRLASDALFARDSRTACFWQQFVGNHAVFVNQFEQQMFRISTVGQNVDELIDCSDTIPAQSAALVTPEAFFPSGFTSDDLELNCDDGEAFPSLITMVGPQVSTQPVQDQDTSFSGTPFQDVTEPNETVGNGNLNL